MKQDIEDRRNLLRMGCTQSWRSFGRTVVEPSPAAAEPTVVAEAVPQQTYSRKPILAVPFPSYFDAEPGNYLPPNRNYNTWTEEPTDPPPVVIVEGSEMQDVAFCLCFFLFMVLFFAILFAFPYVFYDDDYHPH